MDVVIIEPDKGMVKQVGRQLLELADNPRDVQWVTWPVTGYKVPVELAAKLKDVRSLPDTEQPGQATQAPKRRGRPRRSGETVDPVPGTDDTQKEE